MLLSTAIELNANHPIKKRYEFQGLLISVENPAGTVRRGKDHTTGKPWKTKMLFDYGYINNTMGMDKGDAKGDEIDVFVGPNESAKYVYVIHQNNPHSGKYDEDKCMLGFDSPKQARRAYLRHYDSPKFYGSMDIVPVDAFKDKVFATKHKATKIEALWQR